MTKLFSIMFSILILFQSINFSVDDYSRLNSLIEHVKFHQDKYGDSIVEFILEHYSNSHVDSQKQHQEHQDLPFKNDNSNNQHPTNVFTFSLVLFCFENKDLVNVPLEFSYKEFISYFEKTSIFQPPQLV